MWEKSHTLWVRRYKTCPVEMPGRSEVWNLPPNNFFQLSKCFLPLLCLATDAEGLVSVGCVHKTIPATGKSEAARSGADCSAWWQETFKRQRTHLMQSPQLEHYSQSVNATQIPSAPRHTYPLLPSAANLQRQRFCFLIVLKLPSY